MTQGTGPKGQATRLTGLEVELTPAEETVLWVLQAIGGAVEVSVLTMRSGVDAEQVIDFLRFARRVDLVRVELRHTPVARGNHTIISTSYGPVTLTPRGEHVAAEIAARVEQEAASAAP